MLSAEYEYTVVSGDEYESYLGTYVVIQYLARARTVTSRVTPHATAVRRDPDTSARLESGLCGVSQSQSRRSCRSDLRLADVDLLQL